MNMLTRTLLFLTICLYGVVTPESLCAQATLSGKVISQKTNEGVPDATVRITGTTLQTKTGGNGEFLLNTVPDSGTITVSSVGYASVDVSYTSKTSQGLNVRLIIDDRQIDEVVINTGYQYLPKERATGSFDHIDNEMLNRRQGTDLLARLENLSPGLQFNHGDNSVANNDPFVIRGRGTLTAEAQPLIVIDDFPYEGELDNIDPNIIESVTILKDAAAASIWGARSGNGVIVITTKKGKKEKTNIDLTSTLSITGRPDLRSKDLVTSRDRIDYEKFLFSNGRYASAANAATVMARSSPIPEAVELMIKNPTDLQEQLAELSTRDVLKDVERYLYRKAATQQYNVNLSGTHAYHSYFMGGTFDRSTSNLRGHARSRIAIRSGNMFRLGERLQVDTRINFTEIQEGNGNNNGVNAPRAAMSSFSPYTRLADENGNSLPVYMMLRQGFIDTIGQGMLGDWVYRPLDELNAEEHTMKRRDYLINVGAEYRLMEGLNVRVAYQFQNQLENRDSYYKEQSYYVRNLINDYAQINRTSGTVTFPFPKGGILDFNALESTSHQGRAQLNFDRNFGDDHALVALAGVEIRHLATAGARNYNLGYDDETGNLINRMDLETNFRTNTGGIKRIAISDSRSELTDNFFSIFSNAAYTFRKRYTLSASFRKDEANLFGLNANQKGTPLWSLGAAWDISREDFYPSELLSHLKLRMGYGVNGNISRAASAKATILLNTGAFTHSNQQASLSNPPNSELSWERIKQLNVGVDFQSKNGRLSGTVEYYKKSSTDLLAQTPVDPSYGVSSMYMNVADMEGKGFDINLRSNNLIGNFKWSTSLVYSVFHSNLTGYHMPVAAQGRVYLPISLANPIIGRPLYSVFALGWEGLDRETGNPIGRFEGERSDDYNKIYNSTELDNLIFKGTAQPTHYGALINTFSYGAFEFSFNLSFKSGHYFRKKSVSYSSMLNSFTGHADFGKRWEKPGDELTTDVPSLTYPLDPNRDNFYLYSTALVDRGDHIRLEDLLLSYHVYPRFISQRIKQVKLFVNAMNIGTIWTRNKWGIDPYFEGRERESPTVMFGLKVQF